MSTEQKRELISPTSLQLSIVKQCKLFGLQRSSYYVKPKGDSSLNQIIIRPLQNFNNSKIPFLELIF